MIVCQMKKEWVRYILAVLLGGYMAHRSELAHRGSTSSDSLSSPRSQSNKSWEKRTFHILQIRFFWSVWWKISSTNGNSVGFNFVCENNVQHTPLFFFLLQMIQVGHSCLKGRMTHRGLVGWDMFQCFGMYCLVVIVLSGSEGGFCSF